MKSEPELSPLQAMQAAVQEVVGGSASPSVASVATPRERALSRVRTAHGARLASAIGSSLLTWDDLLAAGLPGDSRLAELAMLYREDCPAEFVRESRFGREVMRDPAMPATVARALLRAKPSAAEIRTLSARKDLTNREIQLAALRGRALARRQGKSGGEYAALPCMPDGWLTRVSDAVDDEIIGILRNPHCPEVVVRRHITHGTARVRIFALSAVSRRNLPVESSLVIAARDLPMTDSARFPRRDRVVELANQILAARSRRRPPPRREEPR